MSLRDSRENRRRQALVNGGMKSRLCSVDGLRSKNEREEDIKNFAENTMNELLGWYGYSKVNCGEEARDLSVRRRMRRPSSSSSASPQGTSSPGGSRGEASEDASERELGGPDTGGTATPLLDVESLTPQTGSATVICAWCSKEGLKLFTLKTEDGLTKAFCSELCFDQCRRAAFKKNRMCDWCKHIRHTVNYVDFQDKDHQLQFCSNKCLNQYKMNIFCKETQAYLQMNPHLRDNPGSNSSLITPDLWMKDCKEFANGRPNQCEEDEDSTSLEQPQLFGADNSIQQPAEVKTPCNETRTDTDEQLNVETPKSANEQSDKEDTPKPLEKQQSEPNILPKFNIEKLNSDRRKKHRVTDRSCTFRPERRSSRINCLTDERSDTFSPITSIGSSKKHFPPEHRLLHQSTSPPIYTQPPPLLNGSLPSRSLKSASPCTVVPSIPPVSSTLPPPPPLLNSDLLHHSLMNPQMYQQPMGFLSQQQQQLEAFFAMQNGLGMRMNVPRQPRATYPEALLPNPLTMNGPHPQPFSHPVLPSPTMMLPYPLVIPLPFPIPIPIPIPSSHFQNAKQCLDKGKTSHFPPKTSTTEQAKRVDSIITKLMTRQQEENSNNRGSKENGKKQNIQCSDSNHATDSEHTSGTENVLSNSLFFQNFSYRHDNEQSQPEHLGKSRQKRPNEYSKDKLKRFKLIENYNS